MTSEQFAYWLQGFSELNSEPPTAEQWQAIRDHLALVFKKVTPPLQLAAPAIPYVMGPNAAGTPPNFGVQTLC